MGIALADGFSLKAVKPLDERFQFDTIQDMKNYPQTSLYDGIMAFNLEDEKTYQFNSNNTDDATLGKWKEFSGAGGGGGNSETSAAITATGVSVGAISDGDTVPAGTDIEEFLKMLLMKRIAATYTAPRVTLAKTPNISTFEKGVSTTVSFKPTFTQNDADSATSFDWSDGTSNSNDAAVSYTFTDTVNAKVDVAYGTGPIKNDNFGDPSPTGQIQAGTISATSTITALDPFYYGVGTFNAASPNGTKVVEAKGTKKFKFTTVADTAFIASPYQIAKIVDPNGFDNTNSFTHTTDTYTRADGTSETYHIYTNGAATVTDFEYTFTFA